MAANPEFCFANVCKKGNEKWILGGSIELDINCSCAWLIQLIACYFPEECPPLPGVLNKPTGVVPFEDTEVP